MHLAQWLSPKFAVQVASWVYEWMTEGAPRTKPDLPFHLRRYVKNYQNVPPGHFSVLTEVTLILIAPLEIMGYTLPESMWPDISQGIMFANWLRANGVEHETDASIKAKLKRGTFAATFLLATLAALELEGVRLEDL